MKIETNLKKITELKELHTSWHKGYVSRKSKPEYATLIESGRYKGYYRAYFPSWTSTYYCLVTYYRDDN